jgi:hypothetical protein
MFSNKFDVGIVYVFKVELFLKIIYSLGVTFKHLFSIFYPIFWAMFLLFTFFLEFALFFVFYPNNNCQVKKNRNKKNVGRWDGG